MTTFTTTAQRSAEVTRIAKALGIKQYESGKGFDRILSAMGHPGYGNEFARQAVSNWITTGQSMHSVLYVGR